MTRFGPDSPIRRFTTGRSRPVLSRHGLPRLLTIPLVLAVSVLPAGASAVTLTSTPVKTAPDPVGLWSPAAEGPWFGWERSPDEVHYDYFVQKGAHPKFKVNAKGTSADGGGIDGHTLVYSQQRANQKADLYRFNLRTHQRTAFPAPVNTRYNETWPTLSGRFLLFTRGRALGPVRVSTVMLYDRRTHALRVLGRARSGSYDGSWVTSGQVSGDYAVWSRTFFNTGGWVRSAVFRYDIRTGTMTKLPKPGRSMPHSSSVTSDGTVYYASHSKPLGTSEIVKQALVGTPEVLHSFPGGQFVSDLYVDERSTTRHIYFNLFHGGGGFPDTYQLVDRGPLP